MGYKANKPKWMHHCHKSHRTLVMQGDECEACGRTRTVQAEVKYSRAETERAAERVRWAEAMA